MRRDPEVEGRSVYGARRAEPQEPRAPSVMLADPTVNKPRHTHGSGAEENLPANNFTLLTLNIPSPLSTFLASPGQNVFLSSHSSMAYTLTVQSSPPLISSIIF